MNVAFIPVRGGSKSIPLKNIKEICGKPLVYWTVKAACECKWIDIVYVATDDEKIKTTIESFKMHLDEVYFNKVKIIGRSAESSTDNASTEYAMLEFANEYDFEHIVLIQATSPMLESRDLDGGVDVYNQTDVDSVLSAVRQYRFLWKEQQGQMANSMNYDIYHRPRRQEFDGYLMENGAFYITSKELLLQSQNRISGNIRTYEMCEESAYEIDEPSDWTIIEALMHKKMKNQFSFNTHEVKMFLTDCDGCLTDAGMYYSEAGDESKKFNTRDGMGFSLLKKQGIIVGIVTSENTKLNKRRAEKLQLDVLEQGCKNKLQTVESLCRKYNISLNNVVYVGDDLNDIEVLKNVGIACCPADAIGVVQEISKYITKAKGGEGVIREIVDKVLEQE